VLLEGQGSVSLIRWSLNKCTDFLEEPGYPDLTGTKAIREAYDQVKA
jgi:hypothetical protein